MPIALVAAVIGAEAVATTIVGSPTVGALLSTVGTLALSLGASALLQPGGKKSIQSGQVTAKDSNPSRVRVYGLAKLGGATVLLEAISGARLYICIVHCEGPVTGYDQWWLNDTLTAIQLGSLGGVNPTLPWGGNVIVESHLGTADQAASPILTGTFPWWTAQHRLKGLAYSVVEYVLPPKADKNFQKVFPNGKPDLRVVLRGSATYDPRNGTTYWSRNAGNCILDFLTHARTDATTGRVWQLVPLSRIHQASFADFADLCDEDVPLAAGGTEKRYALDGVYRLDEEPREVLRRMLATCDAELVAFPDGTVGIRGGRFEEPTVTLTDRDLIGAEYAQGNDKLAAFNRLTWTFTDEMNDFQVVQGDPWDDAEAQGTGELLTRSLDLSMVQSHSQGRRLVKIATAKGNPRHKFTGVRAKISALALLGERVVRITSDAFAIDAVFVIDRFEASGDLSGGTLDVSSIEASAYEWDPASEEGQRPAAPTNATDVATVPTPSGITLDLVLQAIYGEISTVRARAASAAPPGDQFQPYWTLAGRYRIAGTSDDWTFATADGDTAVLTGILTDGATYEVQLQYVGLGQESAWVAAGQITALSDPVAPAQPSNAYASGGSGAAVIDWTNPGSANFSNVIVRRAAGATSVYAASVQVGAPVYGAPNQPMEIGDGGLAAGVYRYWLVARNGSGAAASPLGPIDVTVT